MHFFTSNLLYYLQVDVVDSEYSSFQSKMLEACEFQDVLRAHRNFLASVLRMSLVDNSIVQESIDRILQSIVRFMAIARLLHQQEGIDESELNEEFFAYRRKSITPSKVATSSYIPVLVPPEELQAVRGEFFQQILFLFEIMKGVENRGFMFRLDFNGYLSSIAAQSTSKQSSTK